MIDTTSAARPRGEDASAQGDLLLVLLDAIPTPVFYHDTGGAYLGCNRAFERLVGMPREQLVGRRVYDLAPAFKAPVDHQADLALVDSGGEQVYEHRVRYADGTEHDVILRKAAFCGADGRIAGLVCTILQITERKRAEEALAEARRLNDELLRRQGELVRSEKLAAIGRMAATVAHDLKGPLTTIYGFAQLMTMDVPVARREEFLERISGEVRRLADMVEDIMSFVRGEVRVEPEQVELPAFLADLRSFLERYLPSAGIALIIDGAVDGRARFDPDRVRRALVNLAFNARDAMSQGGAFAIHIERDGGVLRFRCSDTGPGVAEEIRGRLFSEFVTHGKSTGTGLGLAICRSVAEEHGGSIRYQTAAGGGACFIIELPESSENGAG